MRHIYLLFITVLLTFSCNDRKSSKTEDVSEIIDSVEISNQKKVELKAEKKEDVQIMNNQIIQKFYVIGISIRTTNENGQSAKDLETLWGKFWGEEIQKQIPNKVNDNIYAVYTDYETDFTGPYTAIIGLSVRSLVSVSKSLTILTLTGRYHS